MTTSDLFPVPVDRVFRFLWIGKRGPTLKTFPNVHTFSGYIAEVRSLLGSSSVEFRTPTLCVGVIK